MSDNAEAKVHRRRKRRQSPEAKLAALVWVSSDERLGQIFGHHRASFPRWRREYPDAPKPRANGDHNVEAWREWFAKHSELKSHPSGEKLALEIERLRLQCDRIKFENDVREGKFLSADYVTRLVSELATLLNATLRTKLEDELPPIIAGLPAPAIRIEMKKVHDEICRMMQEGSKKLSDPS